jgi:5-methylcytosine-specific restriction endonuclease McrA
MSGLTRTPDIWDQVKAEVACDHPHTEIRYITQSNNVKAYKRQCLLCGQATSSALPYAKVSNKENVPPFDEQMRDRYHKKRNARRQELTRASWQGRQAQYYEYLQSTQWREKSRAVLQRDGYTCQACLHRNATQAHHITYEHIYDEPLFDLVSVCTTCHDRLHHLPAFITGPDDD